MNNTFYFILLCFPDFLEKTDRDPLIFYASLLFHDPQFEKWVLGYKSQAVKVSRM